MPRRPIPLIVLLAAVLLAVTALASSAAPRKAPGKTTDQPECPHALSDGDRIIEALSQAPSCAAAFALFQACAAGASGDSAYGLAVTERCQKDFLDRLNKAQKRAYAAAARRCDRKYATEQGTMYVSFTAFCHAELALTYSRRYGRAAPQK